MKKVIYIGGSFDPLGILEGVRRDAARLSDLVVGSNPDLVDPKPSSPRPERRPGESGEDYMWRVLMWQEAQR